MANVQQPATQVPSSNAYLFNKTRMCRFESKGKCTKGEGCKFAHSSVELNVVPDLTCTRMCLTFLETGLCYTPGCTYAHSAKDLRANVGGPIKPSKVRQIRQSQQQEKIGQWRQEKQQEQLQQQYQPQEFGQQWNLWVDQPFHDVLRPNVEIGLPFSENPRSVSTPPGLNDKNDAHLDVPAYVTFSPSLMKFSGMQWPASHPMMVDLPSPCKISYTNDYFPDFSPTKASRVRAGSDSASTRSPSADSSRVVCSV